MSHKNILYSTLFIAVITIGLSVFAGVAYIYTLCGLSAWIAFGHLVTIDDDMPGEWSNPEGSKELWHGSLFVVSTKFVVFFVLLVVVMSFPSLAKYGA